MKRILFLLVGLVLTVGGLEVLSFLALQLRPTGNPLAYPAREANLHFYRPSNGWLFFDVKPRHVQRFRRDEFDTSVRTNNVGLREDIDFTGRADIGFVGDSFTFGHGVNVGERYSDLVRQRIPGMAVWSYADANGYAPPHYHLFLKNNPQFVPKTLVVGLFPWNDLGRDVADMVFERDARGDTVAIRSASQRIGAEGFLLGTGAPEREPVWRRLMREFNLGRVVLLALYRVSTLSLTRASPAPADVSPAPVAPHSSVDHAAFNADARTSLMAIEEIARLVRDRGGEVVVFFIPTSYMVGAYPYFCETLDGYDAQSCNRFRQENQLGLALQDWAQARCLDLIDPTVDFRAREQHGSRLYFAKDGHWTPAGHAAAADLIVDYLARPPSRACTGTAVR